MSIESLSSVLNKISNDIIIAGHRDADYDSMCSSLALALALKQLNKKVKVYIEPESINMVSYFNCDDLLCNEFKYKNYTFIALDLNTVSRLPDSMQDIYLKSNTKINIDHHDGNDMNADYTLSINDISSTCEIIYNLITKLNINIDKLISELIFTGIISDTKLFVNRTTSKTFNIVSKLLKNEIDNNYLINKFYLEKTEDELKTISYIIDNLKFDVFHYAILDMRKEQFNKIVYSNISKKCIPTILSCQSIDTLLLIMDYKDKRKGELRSKKLDIRELAELLGGGGHKHASGFTTDKSIEEIINISKKYLKSKKY